MIKMNHHLIKLKFYHVMPFHEVVLENHCRFS